MSASNPEFETFHEVVWAVRAARLVTEVTLRQ